jgi:hypothetical protein
MKISRNSISLTILFFLSACGGGGGDESSSGASNTNNQTGIPPVTSVPVSTYAETRKSEAFQRVNEIRQQVGLGLLAQNEKLDKSSQGHAEYLALNNEFSHLQTLGKNGFTGLDPEARVFNSGYPVAAGAEIINFSKNLSGKMQIDELMAGVYHRAPLLSSSYVDVGVGNKDYLAAPNSSALVVSFAWMEGRGPQDANVSYVVWPRNNDVIYRTTNPPENPKSPGLGYPVSVSVNPEKAFTVSNFELRESGNLVPAFLVSNFRGYSALSPRDSLKAATKYSVSFDGFLDGKPLNIDWEFSTP